MVVAVSNGDIAKRETLAIDQDIVRRCGDRPRNALFVPTASRDAPSYTRAFIDLYGRELGCDVRTLEVFDERSRGSEKELLRWATIIYVGGGNTDLLMAMWRAYGIDEMMREVQDEEKVFCGMSAGAICWFDSGFAMAGTAGPQDRTPRYGRVAGLGFIPGMYAPHIESELRMLALTRHVATTGEPAYAAMDRTAIYYAAESMEFVACSAGQSIFRLTAEAESVRITELQMTNPPQPSRLGE